MATGWSGFGGNYEASRRLVVRNIKSWSMEVSLRLGRSFNDEMSVIA
jgi:hypothetical protein